MEVKPFEGICGISKEKYLANKEFLDKVFLTSFKRRCEWTSFMKMYHDLEMKGK